MPEEITCPECSYKGHGRARHKPGCPLRGAHGGLRTEPHGGRITASVDLEHYAMFKAFQGDRTPKAAMEGLINMALSPKKTRLIWLK